MSLFNITDLDTSRLQEMAMIMGLKLGLQLVGVSFPSEKGASNVEGPFIVLQVAANGLALTRTNLSELLTAQFKKGDSEFEFYSMEFLCAEQVATKTPLVEISYASS